MSGIYIPNIEMPDDCIHCPCADLEYFDCNLMPGTGTDHKKRREGCPLIPVPEHGRLGDLDELKERATKRLYASNHGSMAEAYFAALIDLIDTAPTVIPADKEAEK